MLNPFRIPILTRRRIWLAAILAVAADSVQLALGPAGWVVVTQVIDVFMMIATTLLIGFHPLLLPTFVIEFIPLADMLPTWTGCVLAVVALRKRAQASVPPPLPPRPPGVIDV